MTEPAYALAVFMAATDQNGREIPEDQRKEIPVHFNPETLDITFTNTVQRGNRNQPAQVVNETTAKLSMELIFDTSLTGADVRAKTHEIARLMDPAQQTPRRRNADEVKVPAIVVFQWGTILFEGYIDTYRERVEFFSAEGVALRAVVSLSMTQQQRSFSPAQTSGNQPAKKRGADLTPDRNEPVRRLGSSENLTETAGNLGDAGAAKALAAQNGIENMRHPEVDEIVVAPFSFQAALNFSASAGAGGNGATVSVAAGKTAAQFAGLRTQVSATAGLTPRIQLSLDVGGEGGQVLALTGKGGFQLGGQVTADAGASLTADVGLDADIELGIRFEE